MMKSGFGRGEFMDFMDKFLQEHPEIVKDQRYGWNIHWNPRKQEPVVLNFPRGRFRTR